MAAPNTRQVADDLIAKGYKLCAVVGKKPKGNDWGKRPVASAAFLGARDGIGIVHGLSGTISVDEDHFDLAQRVLDAAGVPLPDEGVPTWTGRPGRRKRLYRVPAGVRVPGVRKLTAHLRGEAGKVRAVTVLELRGSTEGEQCQDVIPPTVHPDTGEPYKWLNGMQEFPPVSELPEMPAALVAMIEQWDQRVEGWRELCGDVHVAEQRRERSRAKARQAGRTSEQIAEDERLIADFNAGHYVGAILEAHGWTPKGRRRWLRPDSKTGIPGTVLYPDTGKVWAHDGSTLADGAMHDAFDLVRILDHGGDWRAAFVAARAALGRPDPGDAPGPDWLFGDGGDEPPPPDEEPPDVGGDRVPKPGGDNATDETRADWLLPMCEIISEPAPPRWQIRGIVERGVLCDTYGKREGLKSFLELSFDMHIASGRTWFGHLVEQAPVAYLAGEGNAGLRRRIRAWLIANGIGDEEAAAMPFTVSRAGAALLDAAQFRSALAALRAFAERHGSIGRVSVDTMARFMVPGDENSTRDMGAFIGRLDLIRQEFDCTVSVVHHTGHGTDDRARGSSAWPAALDASVRIERPNMDEPKAVAHCDKAKDGERFESFEYTCAVVELPWTDEHGTRSTSLAVTGVGEARFTKPGGNKLNLGRAQRAALKSLAEQIARARRNLETSGRNPDEARIDRKTWLTTAGVDWRRQSEIVAALVARQLITVDEFGNVALTPDGEAVSHG